MKKLLIFGICLYSFIIYKSYQRHQQVHEISKLPSVSKEYTIDKFNGVFNLRLNYLLMFDLESNGEYITVGLSTDIFQSDLDLPFNQPEKIRILSQQVLKEKLVGKTIMLTTKNINNHHYFTHLNIDGKKIKCPIHSSINLLNVDCSIIKNKENNLYLKEFKSHFAINIPTKKDFTGVVKRIEF